jgi:hypothetical protein
MGGRADILVLGENFCAKIDTVKTSAGRNGFSRDERIYEDLELAVVLVAVSPKISHLVRGRATLAQTRTSSPRFRTEASAASSIRTTRSPA